MIELLEARPVSTAAHIEVLRLIRNATTYGFSNDNSEISEQAQRAWWVVMRARIRVWLYYANPKVVGFGMLRLDDEGRWWNSLAVLPVFQGKGYGSFITADLLTRHDGTVYSSVRRDNLPAIRMHNHLQWRRIEGPDERLVYFQSREG